MIRPCDRVVDMLASSEPLDSDCQRHLEHCPECAEIAHLPALVEQASRVRAAVDVKPGFTSRVIANASERMSRRRHMRIGFSAAAVAAAAVIAVATVELLPGMLASDADRAEMAENRSDEPVRDDGEAKEGPTEDQPVDLTTDAPVADDGQLETRDLVSLADVDDALAFHANWRAAGGHVSAGDIGRFKDELGLSKEQRQQLRKLIAEQEKAEIKLRSDIKVANVDLRTLLAGDAPDERTVARLIEKISDLEARVRKGRVLSWIKARKLLDAKQQRMLAGQLDHGHRAHDLDTPPMPRPPRHAERRGDGPERDSERFFGRGLDRELDVEFDFDWSALDQLGDGVTLKKEVLEAMKQAEQETRRAREEVRREMERVRRELEKVKDLKDLKDLKNLKNLEALKELEELEELDFGKIGEEAMREVERAREEAMRAKEQALKEMERVQVEIERARRDAEKARHGKGWNDHAERRAHEEAAREAERAREEAMRAREEAMRQAERAREKAMRKAERSREKAMRKAERSREKALRKAAKERRKALRQKRKALREALRERRKSLRKGGKSGPDERALKELERELENLERDIERDIEVDVEHEIDGDIEVDVEFGNKHRHRHQHKHKHHHKHQHGAQNQPSQPGTLLVNSAPWAEVAVDGEKVGNTPLRLQLEPGQHNVKLEWPGHGVRRMTVKVQPGETRKVNIQRPQPRMW